VFAGNLITNCRSLLSYTHDLPPQVARVIRCSDSGLEGDIERQASCMRLLTADLFLHIFNHNG